MPQLTCRSRPARPESSSGGRDPAYREKYTAQIERFGMTPAAYAARFSVPVRILLTRLDGRRR